jgi:hypothetical protein
MRFSGWASWPKGQHRHRPCLRPGHGRPTTGPGPRQVQHPRPRCDDLPAGQRQAARDRRTQARQEAQRPRPCGAIGYATGSRCPPILLESVKRAPLAPGMLKVLSWRVPESRSLAVPGHLLHQQPEEHFQAARLPRPECRPLQRPPNPRRLAQPQNGEEDGCAPLPSDLLTRQRSTSFFSHQYVSGRAETQLDASASHHMTGYSPRPVGGSVASTTRALRSLSRPALVRGNRAWWQYTMPG